jgi:hypothetical protein
MNKGFLKTTLVIIFAVIVFLFFSVLRSIIDTTNDIDEVKEIKSEVDMGR